MRALLDVLLRSSSPTAVSGLWRTSTCCWSSGCNLQQAAADVVHSASSSHSEQRSAAARAASAGSWCMAAQGAPHPAACRPVLPTSLLAHSAWSSSRGLSTSSQSAGEAPTSVSSQVAAATSTASPVTPRWNWKWVVGEQRSRKPAIKRPSRHQWHFCNPNYDRSQPLPDKMLTPYDPPTAALQDEWQTYRRLLSQSKQRSTTRFDRQFQHWLKLRDVDRRNAFHQAMAADIKAEKARERRAKEAKRQAAWEAYKQKLIAEASGAGQ